MLAVDWGSFYELDMEWLMADVDDWETVRREVKRQMERLYVSKSET